jgi:hypothetical protein
MLQKLFSILVETKQDMAKVEEVVGGLLGGEYNKCAFTRSHEFIKLRLHALYPRKSDGPRASNLSVYGEGLKITLTPSGVVCVFITDPCFEPVPVLPPAEEADMHSGLGKRSFRQWDLPDVSLCGSSGAPSAISP